MNFPLRATAMMVVRVMVVPVAVIADEVGRPINAGAYRDGMVYWNNSQRSWITRESPGVMLGDVASGRHYNFNRS
ncbi:MAG: hypothetical protein ABI607_04480 [Betaproteobacteria bacterium]